MTAGLIIVDVQRDFLPGGALAVGKGDEVVPFIVEAVGAFEIACTSQDWHPADHCSFAADPAYEDGSWPVHCVMGTPGAALHPKIAALDLETFHKGFDPTIEAYSAFAGYTPQPAVGLEAWLLDREVESLTIVGLALDWCVKRTAIDAANKGWPTTVLMEGCRAVDKRRVKHACREMEAAGVVIA